MERHSHERGLDQAQGEEEGTATGSAHLSLSLAEPMLQHLGDDGGMGLGLCPARGLGIGGTRMFFFFFLHTSRALPEVTVHVYCEY